MPPCWNTVWCRLTGTKKCAESWVTTVSFLPEHCGKRMGRWRQIKARPTQTLTEGCKQMFKIKTLKSNLEKQVVSLCSLVSVWVWSLVLFEGRSPHSSTSVSCECLDSQRVPFCMLKNLPEMFVPCWDLRIQRWLRCGLRPWRRRSREGETVEGPSVYRHSEDFINIQNAWAPYACTWPRFQGVGHGVWGWGFSIMLGVLLLNLLYRACQGKCHVPMIRFSNWLSKISKDLPFTKSRIFFLTNVPSTFLGKYPSFLMFVAVGGKSYLLVFWCPRSWWPHELHSRLHPKRCVIVPYVSAKERCVQ